MYVDVCEWRRLDPDHAGKFGGPVKALLQSLQGIGATFLNPGQIQYCTPENESRCISLLEPEEKKFAHEMREAARAQQWANLADRRRSFEGIEFGADRKATCVLLKDKVTGLMLHRLRCLLTGAVATYHRLYRARVLTGNACPCCNLAAETMEHISDDCPVMADLRARNFTAGEWATLPPCLRYHGILPAGDEGMPRRYADHENGREGLVADVQYTLIDMLERRESYMDPGLRPQPRWNASRTPLPAA